MKPEEIIQAAVIGHLRTRATGDFPFWHTPNGGHRHIAAAAKFKKLGVLAGVSDILAFRNRELFALELKAPKGRPTEAQMEYIARINDNGGYGVVAEGLDEAIACLEAWGLLRRAA